MGVMIIIYIHGLQPGTPLSLRPSRGMGTGINGGLKTGQEKQRLSHTGRQEMSQKKRRMMVMMMIMITASPITLSYKRMCVLHVFLMSWWYIKWSETSQHHQYMTLNDNIACLCLHMMLFFSFFNMPTLKRTASVPWKESCLCYIIHPIKSLKSKADFLCYCTWCYYCQCMSNKTKQ